MKARRRQMSVYTVVYLQPWYNSSWYFVQYLLPEEQRLYFGEGHGFSRVACNDYYVSEEGIRLQSTHTRTFYVWYTVGYEINPFSTSSLKLSIPNSPYWCFPSYSSSYSLICPEWCQNRKTTRRKTEESQWKGDWTSLALQSLRKMRRLTLPLDAPGSPVQSVQFYQNLVDASWLPRWL